MIIRQATNADYDQLVALFYKAHKRSPYDLEHFHTEHIRHLVAVAAEFDIYFLDVIEEDGSIIGALGGMMSASAAGAKVATDIINISGKHTDLLFKRFIKWAEDSGAEYVSVTNISGVKRYDKFIVAMGFKPVGTTYLMEI